MNADINADMNADMNANTRAVPNPGGDDTGGTPRIGLLRCTDCGTWWALAPYACARCGGVSLASATASGHGVVQARSEIARAPDDRWRALLPYALVLVRLEEGPTLMGHVSGAAAIGDRVYVQRVALRDGTPIWQFRAVT